MAQSNYSIIADVELELKKAKQQLDEFKKNNKLNLDVNVNGGNKIKDLGSQTDSLNNSTKEVTLTYQQFRQVLDSVVEVAGKMYEQVKTLDSAVTEYSKVTELSGDALDQYVSKLSAMGKEVGRTGKPNRSEPVCCDGKAA